MRSRILLPLITLAALAAPAPALAYFGHVVATGESLSSVAAADGLSVSQLAAANGLSADAQLTAGSTLQIPPQGGVTDAAQSTSSVAAPTASTGSTGSGGDYTVQPGDTLSGLAARSGVTVDQLAAANGLSPDGLLIAGATLQTPSPGDASGSTVSASTEPAASQGSGGYTVQPGDTLSAIAARSGVSVDQLAAANGLDPAGILLAGAVLSVSGGSQSTPVSMVTSAPASSSAGGAQPTPETVSPGEVGQIAADHGVSPSLAEAIGYQESGFNNDLVSSTGATGVMQIEPGTWNYIGQSLATPPPLSPASASDNIRGGVLLLHSLLNQTGGDPAMAAAGYYQGMASVQQHGLYSDTQRYVNNVMALRQRFGGP